MIQLTLLSSEQVFMQKLRKKSRKKSANDKAKKKEKALQTLPNIYSGKKRKIITFQDISRSSEPFYTKLVSKVFFQYTM